jgi:alkyl sulfatase BDS1-like metallo-beta-lactamase superfamily hydrolase
MNTRRIFCLMLALGSVSLACGKAQAPARPAAAPPPGLSEEEIAGLAWTFREKAVDEVAPGVYVARGYGLANSAMIVGEQGRIIVDTLETTGAAREARAAFDAISTAPIRAIFYTHGHPDHTGGTRAFLDDPATPVYAHENLPALLAEQQNVASGEYRVRAIRQFGLALPEDAPAHFLRLDLGEIQPPILPNAFIHGAGEDLEIAGLRLEVRHAPGESMDQIAIWLPDRKTLLAGDNVYPAFPNLYTLRGEPSRDVLRWSNVMDQLAAFDAEHLVPFHGAPLHGAERIREMLTNYGDAIQFVHDQTVRGALEGKRVDELAARIALPKHLAEEPGLREAYGRVDWSVRAIYGHYFGFFDGDAASIRPLAPEARAAHLAALAGGPEALRDAMQAALNTDPQWAAELADHLIALEAHTAEAKQAKATAFDRLAAGARNLNAVNYYQTQAAELRGEITVKDPVERLSPEFLATVPIEVVLRSMAIRLNVEKSLELDQAIVFHFSDINEDWTVHIRRGIAEVRRGRAEAPVCTVTIPAQVWKEILTGKRNRSMAFLANASIDGSLFAAKNFLELFAPEE